MLRPAPKRPELTRRLSRAYAGGMAHTAPTNLVAGPALAEVAPQTASGHLAGRLGVGLADRLQAKGHLMLSDGACLVTDGGRAFLGAFGLGLDAGGPRPLCRTCLDWSERRSHLAGRLGAALLDRTLALGWIRRLPDSHAVLVTEAGRRGFAATFGVKSETPGSSSMPVLGTAR